MSNKSGEYAIGDTFTEGDGPNQHEIAHKRSPREHELTEHCWCNPRLDYEDPVTGRKVWRHTDVN